jgi:hypothetical protein
MKVLYVITKANWGDALWKPTVFQRSPLKQVTAFLHGELPFPNPFPAPRQFALTHLT